MKWYGNVTNRLEEGKQLAPIQVGTDITMYHWSDRDCYYITEVIDDKHIKVKPWVVVADHSKPGGAGHQDWMYFKTYKEASDYLKSFGFDGYRNDIKEREEDWVYRYNKWQKMYRYTEDNYCTDREKKSLEKKGYYDRYYNLGGKVSFGVRDYYFDWSF